MAEWFSNLALMSGRNPTPMSRFLPVLVGVLVWSVKLEGSCSDYYITFDLN